MPFVYFVVQAFNDPGKFPPVTDSMPLQLLIVGQTDRAEALPLAEWMSHALQPANVERHAGLDAALEQLAAGDLIPDLIVVVQSWPDEVTRQEIDRLSRFAPLARWVVCCGAWCESDGRTRDLWPLAVRVPLRSAMSRLQHEWRLLCGENVAPLPMSASREETFAIDHPEPGGGVAAGSLPVIVRSPDPEYRRYLQELLVRAGYVVECEVGTNEDRADAGSPLRICLLDLDPWNEQRQADVRELRNRFPNDRIVGLMSLPSPEATAELMELGVVDVLPKLGDQQRIIDTIAHGACSEAVGMVL